MSRQEFTELEEQRLAERKFIILEDEKGRQFGSKIVTHTDKEYHLTKNDRGFYLKSSSLVGFIDEYGDEEINKTFGSFEEVIKFLR